MYNIWTFTKSSLLFVPVQKYCKYACMCVQCIPYELLYLCGFMLTLLDIPLNTKGCKTTGISS